MAIYKCKICGAVYDEEKEHKPVSALSGCPVCKQPVSNLVPLYENGEQAAVPQPAYAGELSYDSATARQDPTARYMAEIHEMAVTGKSIGGAMSTKMPMPNWDDILLLGAQLNPPPLDDGEPVDTVTVIGKHAKKPMVLNSPVYISHMSFGALSREVKIALAKGSAMAKTAMCSGEGGILPEEKQAAYKYIFEYIPNEYSVTDENLRSSDAIEIKIGQGTKPGMGGHLPGEKVTAEIAAIRGKNRVRTSKARVNSHNCIPKRICAIWLICCADGRRDGRSVSRSPRGIWSAIWNTVSLLNPILLRLTAEAARPAPVR